MFSLSKLYRGLVPICSLYLDLRRTYIKKYYLRRLSTYKLCKLFKLRYRKEPINLSVARVHSTNERATHIMHPPPSPPPLTFFIDRLLNNKLTQQCGVAEVSHKYSATIVDEQSDHHSQSQQAGGGVGGGSFSHAF